MGAALRGQNPTVLARLEAGFAVIGDVQFLHAHVWPRYEWEGPNHVSRPVALHPLQRWRAPLPHTVLGPQHEDLRAALRQELAHLSAMA